MDWKDQLWGSLRCFVFYFLFKTWRSMNGLLHLNLHYRENNILLWAKTEIREISFLSQVNYFWWKASQRFATGKQLYTQNIMHIHTESTLLGVSILMPSSMPSSPAKLFMESKENNTDSEMAKKPPPNPTTTKNVGTENQIDKEKGSFT